MPRPSDAHSECEHAYASPIVYDDGTMRFLLTHGADYSVAFDLKDGREIWRVGGLHPADRYDPTLRFVSSPVAVDGMIVIPSAKQGFTVAVKPNGKGNITGKQEYYHWIFDVTPDVPSPLILEDYEHACRRGADILAEVVGFATNCDGVHLVRPNPQTMKQVMQDALTSAGLSASDIGYISGHGTATLQGDLAESVATQEVMGSHTPFSALKSYIGHSRGACGSLEAWTAIQMMREKWFMPNLNLDELDPNCGQLDYIRDEVREIDTDYVMSNNFAFGGVNTSLIFRRV